MGNDSSSNNGFMFFWRELKRRGYTIPLLITFTYLLFVVIPVLVIGVCFLIDGGCLYISGWVWEITYILNNISDVLIYVFCDRDIQNHLKNMFARFRGNVQNNNNTNVQSINNTTEIELSEVNRTSAY